MTKNPIFAPLPFKELPHVQIERIKRVILFDPTDVYSRSIIDPFSRHQGLIGLHEMFPPVHSPHKCDCGCGMDLTGRRKRWATDDCSIFVNRIYSIIYGDTGNIGFYLKRYYGDHCAHCGSETSDLHVDHIIPVKHGGGGSWLNNFQLLCHPCHVQKTKNDFGWKGSNKELTAEEKAKLLFW